MAADGNRGIDSDFVRTMFQRAHGMTPSQDDAAGLAHLIGPIDALAEIASERIGTDDAPADFDRVMAELAAGKPSR